MTVLLVIFIILTIVTTLKILSLANSYDETLESEIHYK